MPSTAPLAPLTALCSDAALRRAAAAGDPRVADALYARHAARARLVCERVLRSRHDAEDAVQETLITVLRRLPALDGEELDLGAYVAAVARSKALDLGRRRARRLRLEAPSDGAVDRVVALDDPVADVLRAERAAQVRTALGTLPQRSARLLVLHHLADLSLDQVAAHEGGNANSVAQATFRARRRLRSALHEHGLAA